MTTRCLIGVVVDPIRAGWIVGAGALGVLVGGAGLAPTLVTAAPVISTAHPNAAALMVALRSVDNETLTLLGGFLPASEVSHSKLAGADERRHTARRTNLR